MSSLDDDLENQSYNIKDELQVRKILESNTNWDFEFTKNNKYQYDLRLYRWGDSPDSPDDNEVFGYIEVERASSNSAWITGDIPDNWVYLSFLERKIRQYDYRRGCWGDLKDDYRKTVYLKFNHAMDNCFVAPIASVYRDGDHTKRSDGSPTNTYRSLPKNHPDVRVGISESVQFIEEYLERIDDDQIDFAQFDNPTRADGGGSDD